MTVNIEGLGKITASKEVLNTLVCAFMHERDYYKSRGLDILAEEADVKRKTVYDALYETCFYRDVE